MASNKPTVALPAAIWRILLAGNTVCLLRTNRASLIIQPCTSEVLTLTVLPRLGWCCSLVPVLILSLLCCFSVMEDNRGPAVVGVGGQAAAATSTAAGNASTSPSTSVVVQGTSYYHNVSTTVMAPNSSTQSGSAATAVYTRGADTPRLTPPLGQWTPSNSLQGSAAATTTSCRAPLGSAVAPPPPMHQAYGTVPLWNTVPQTALPMVSTLI